jgi:hypothetical protein
MVSRIRNDSNEITGIFWNVALIGIRLALYLDYFFWVGQVLQ